MTTDQIIAAIVGALVLYALHGQELSNITKQLKRIADALEQRNK